VEPSTFVAYLAAAAASLTVAYIVGKLRLPRWAYWAIAIVCFASSMLIAGLFLSWGEAPPWSNAISIGLVAVAGASAGLGFHGGIGAHMRPNTSFERTRER
jgi:uncharacterized membrane protein YccC